MGGQALGMHLIVCICMYILGTCYVEARHSVRTLWYVYVCIYWALAMWRAGTWYIPYSMYMYVYTVHLLCGGQALGTHLIVCICMYILGTCYVDRHLLRTL